MADSCGDYISADDLKAGKQSILHIEHVATSKDSQGNPVLSVTDTIRGNEVTNTTLDGLFANIGFRPVNGSFEDGGTIINRWDVLLYKANGSYYQWSGTLPKTVAPGSTPTAETGWIDRTDLTAYNRVFETLAETDGLSKIGTPFGVDALTYCGVGRGADPRFFGYTDDATATEKTAAVLAAFNYSNTHKCGVALYEFFEVTNTFSLESHADYSVFGSGGIISKGSGTASIDMKNCRNVKWHPGTSLTNAGTYTYGFKVWGDSTTGTSLNSFGTVIVGYPVAYRFGDTAYPDALCSEMVVHNGYTFNCRRVYEAYGSQAVIEFNHYQMLGQAPTTVGTNIQGIGDNWGAVIHINGGEVITATDPLSQAFRSFPINSPGYEHAYGTVYINGAAVECRGLWFIAYNPDGVASPSEGSGGIIMDSCHGFAAFDGVNIQVAGAFTGKVVIDKSCKFHRLTNKPSAMVIASENAYPKCDISDDAFDDNFPKGFQKYNGTCVPKFTYRRIGLVSNLSGQSIAGGGNQTDLRFQNIDSTALQDNGMMIDNYVKTSGVFTVPKGGLKNVCLYVQWDVGSGHAGSTLYVMTNLTNPVAVINGDLRLITGFVQMGNLNEGTTISLRYQNGGSTFSSFSKNDDYFALFCSR